MLILPAAPTAAVSGQQDKSIVFFSWRGNQSARSYNVPANPKTANQQAVRNTLAALASSWATLTDAQRQAWTNYAAANPTRDRFGRPVTPTGLNWYIKANSNLLYQGLAAVANAPAANPPAPITSGTLDATAPDTLTLNYTSDGSTGYKIKCQIEVTPTVAWSPRLDRARMVAGVNAASYQAYSSTVGATTATWTYDGSFGDGQQVAAWFSLVRTADGTESIPLGLVTLGVF